MSSPTAAPAAPPQDLRHELASLACAGMTPAQIARQLNCSEKNVYAMLAEAIAGQQVSLEQALDLPEELLGESRTPSSRKTANCRRWRRWRSVSASGCRVACCTARAALQVELES